MRIAICDDERGQRDYLEQLVRRWGADCGEPVDCVFFPCAEAFLFAYETEKNIDLLLLDIEMNRDGAESMNGLALARRLRGENSSLPIVFITGFAEYMGQGYDVAALHYLLKPVRPEKLFEVLSRAKDRLARRRCTLLIESDGQQVLLYQDEILLIEAFLHASVIRLSGGGCHEVKQGITQLRALLEPSLFVCPHRSYLAGLAWIRRIGRESVVMEGGAELLLSRGRFDEVNRAFVTFHKGRREP